ncbi:right-handed parallel beta-helix repeat-containing protein, partial [Candidatus Sumerlaeota bacterium]|nr:right-handed parallel beta-helix repeat-containing protein [Candidatus Sumerlaeota bacterium]
MKKITALLSLIAIFMMGAGIAQAEQVYYSSGRYYWDAGNSTDLATAITGAIGSGNRTVDIWCGGTLYSTIYLQPGLTLKCHNNTFIKGHGGDGFYRDGSGPYAFYDMTLTRSDKSGMGIRTSRASDATFVNVKITGGSIGIRVDSHPSRPYEDGRWVYNLYVQDCTFENTGSHGLETYGVDGCGVYGITANNCGECGVLFNKTLNASTGTVNAYRCCYGGGYAGLRYANTCGNSTANMLYADECGRGYFVLTGSYNITLKNCQITDCSDVGIWLENVTNCSVQSGCCNCGVAVSGSGSYANVSSTCGSSSSSSSGITGTKKIINRASGKGMDAGGNSNGS